MKFVKLLATVAAGAETMDGEAKPNGATRLRRRRV
jgi:hypothetical protein